MDIITRRCSKCKRTFPATPEYFQRQKGRKDGLHSWCKECKCADQRSRFHQRYIEHREEYQEKARKAYQTDPEKQSKRHKKWYLTHKEVSNQRARDNQRKTRLDAIAAYGGKCECCGETRFEFLAIDHINGGGRKHRLSIPGGSVYRWLKHMNYPKEGFRILCHNCNMALAFYGYCPHQV